MITNKITIRIRITRKRTITTTVIYVQYNNQLPLPPLPPSLPGLFLGLISVPELHSIAKPSSNNCKACCIN